MEKCKIEHRKSKQYNPYILQIYMKYNTNPENKEYILSGCT